MDGPAAQPNRRSPAYIVFLALIAAAPPLSTDMYLAAIPHIADQWQRPVAEVTLSLILWFVAYSAMLLVWGSLSDRYGRRPILLIGITLFVLASAGCAASQNVVQLIIARIIQGAGAAGPSSMAMAICRDKYAGKDRQRVLAWMGIIIGLMPMVAPLIGSAVMALVSWRAIFIVQGAMGAAALIISLVIYRETIAELDRGPFTTLFTRYLRVGRNVNYMLANGVLGLMVAPFLGFIAFAPVAYIKLFGFSEQQFSYLFGFNALMSMLGAFACTQLIRKYHEHFLLVVCLLGCLIASVLLLIIGGSHWALFAGAMAVFTIFASISRPLSNHVILEQVDHDIGAASSGIVFLQFITGGACMALVTLEWSRPFLAFALIGLIATGAATLAWPMLRRRLAIAAATATDRQINDALETTIEESTAG